MDGLVTFVNYDLVGIGLCYKSNYNTSENQSALQSNRWI